MSTIPANNGTGTSIAPSGGLGDWINTGAGKRIADAADPNTLTASDGTVISIDADTGSVTIGAPAVRRQRDPAAHFDDNLLDQIDPHKQGALASDILDGIRTDEQSRQPFITNYNKGIELLGLKIEDASSSQRGPRRSISKYRHPALLEACTTYQSLARSQLLPSTGPVKIVEAESGDAAQQARALEFQDAFNYYFTDIATEFYPDMDRGLFYQGYGGTVYKKVYHCPRRRRPVSECVYLPSLIVSEDATDLQTAVRVTHEIMMSHTQLRRMQIGGAWADVNLGMPQADSNMARRKEKQASGLTPSSTRPQDMPYTIYECYTDFDPQEYGLPAEDAPEGLPLPYRVTIERDSMQILEIRRNWKPEDEEFNARQRFVKYGLVPGLGFLDYGFLHLLGNQTRALTALWQLMIDSGMLANFPGGIKSKNARMSTNELMMGLGEFLDVDVPMGGGTGPKLADYFMTMPYRDVTPAAIQLAQMIEENVRRMGGTVELEVGEGRANVPVGTIMAMIEQQTQTVGAIHKRNWTAQKREIALLRELFLEDPEALWKLAPNPSLRPSVAEDFADLTLVPFSDPQVPSQIHRIMQAQTLEQMATVDPIGLNRQAIHLRSFAAMGIADGDSLIAPPQPPDQPQAPPMNPADALKAQAAMQKVQADTQNKSQQAALEVQKLDANKDQQQREAAAQLLESQQRDKDRVSEEQIRAAELQLEREKIAEQARQHDTQIRHDAIQGAHDRLIGNAHHAQGLAADEQARQQAAAQPNLAKPQE